MMLLKNLKFFHVLCLSKIDREKVFADVLDKKEALKDYQNVCFLKTQNKNIYKFFVHRFGKKFEISSTWVFMQNRPRKSIWKCSS